MGRLDNKVAIVTGGASGIGKAIVERFAKEGAQVIALDINEDNLSIFANKDNITAKKLDVSSDEGWEKLTFEILDQYSKIDILINNAGITSQKRFKDIGEDDWQKMMAVNSFGAFAGIKHIAPHMAERNSGSIVNISSYTAIIGQGFNHYTASKGAVRSISKAAATEFGYSGVRVNALFPGVIETPMTDNLKEFEEQLKGLIQATPLQRLGKPKDIADAALFLASDEASYITGAELVIDGGFSAH